MVFLDFNKSGKSGNTHFKDCNCVKIDGSLN